MEETSAAAEHARRRLLFRATHRGTKEADWLLGCYVRSRLDTISEAEVTELECVLALPDPWLTDILTGRVAIPEDHELREVLRRMRSAVTEIR